MKKNILLFLIMFITVFYGCNKESEQEKPEKQVEKNDDKKENKPEKNKDSNEPKGPDKFYNTNWVMETVINGEPQIIGLTFLPGNDYLIHSDKGFIAYEGSFSFKKNVINIKPFFFMDTSNLEDKFRIYKFLMDKIIFIPRENESTGDIETLVSENDNQIFFTRINGDNTDSNYKGIVFSNRMKEETEKKNNKTNNSKEIKVTPENYSSLEVNDIINNNSVFSFDTQLGGETISLYIQFYQGTYFIQHRMGYSAWTDNYTVEGNKIILQLPPKISFTDNNWTVDLIDLFFPAENGERPTECVLEFEKDYSDLFRMGKLNMVKNKDLLFKSNIQTPKNHIGMLDGIKVQKSFTFLNTTDYTPIYTFPDTKGPKASVRSIDLYEMTPNQFATKTTGYNVLKNPQTSEILPFVLLSVLAVSVSEDSTKWYYVRYYESPHEQKNQGWIQQTNPVLMSEDNKVEYREELAKVLIEKGYIEEMGK